MKAAYFKIKRLVLKNNVYFIVNNTGKLLNPISLSLLRNLR